MTEEECLSAIENGATAEELLADAMPTAARRFYRTCATLHKLMEEIQEHFPDANLYSANGTVCLMLGNSHSQRFETQQQELVAHTAPKLDIGGGDW